MTIKVKLSDFSYGPDRDYVARDDNEDGEHGQVAGWGATPEEALWNFLDLEEDEEVTDELFNRVLALAQREADYGRC